MMTFPQRLTEADQHVAKVSGSLRPSLPTGHHRPRRPQGVRGAEVSSSTAAIAEPRVHRRVCTTPDMPSGPRLGRAGIPNVQSQPPPFERVCPAGYHYSVLLEHARGTLNGPFKAVARRLLSELKRVSK